MSWNQSDLRDGGWETAACAGSCSFICMSLVLALWPTAHFLSCSEDIWPLFPTEIASACQRFLPGVFGSQRCSSLPERALSADIKHTPHCAAGRQVGLCGEGYLGAVWSAECIHDVHGFSGNSPSWPWKRIVDVNSSKPCEPALSAHPAASPGKLLNH